MLQYEIIPVTHFEQNCTLLWDSESSDAVLIDAGGDIAKLEQALTSKNLTLKELWVTHAHIDHIGGVGELALKYNVPVIGPHINDKFWIDALPMQSQMFGFAPSQTFTPTRWLEHGDVVEFNGHTFDIRFTPGHSPGHVVFYCAKEKLLWSGDVLFKGGMGRTDLPQGDHATLVASIKEQMYTLPDDTTFICGHGEPSTIAHEKQFNAFVRA